MKKFLLMLPLIFLLQVAQVSAEKVYVGTNDYGDAEIYILTETIRSINWQGYSGFSVQVKSSDGNSPRVSWNYVYKDGQWCYLSSLDDMAWPVPAKGIVLKVAQTANQYR